MASELSLQFWLEFGKESLQLSGNELLTFAESKFSERMTVENNRIEREEKKERERIEREEKLERERVEREERALERRRLKKEEDRKLEYEKLELENRKLDKTNSDNSNAHISKEFSVAIPKLPLYESGEDITAYLIRFETVARLSKWPKEIWPTRLALLFSGATLNVYSTLPEEVCKNYDALKAAVLKAFRKTPEQYRREFRYAKFKQENFMQYLTNLYRLFDFWVDSAKIQKT